MPVITNIEDLRLLAEKRVPRMFYDYADSGSWTEGTYRANASDFQKILLRQRVAVDMANRSTATTMARPATAPALALKWIQKLRSGPGGKATTTLSPSSRRGSGFAGPPAAPPRGGAPKALRGWFMFSLCAG